MKKTTIRIYSIVAFAVLPIIIILIGVIVFLHCRASVTAPTVDFDNVTSKTQKGELWEELTIVEGRYAYAIYAIDNYYDFDDAELIAFRSSSIEKIEDTIRESNPGAFVTSYWEGKGRSFDFTDTYDFKQYLEDIKNASYYGEAPDPDVITDAFSDITLYDLSEYKGYEYGYNNGIGVALVFVFWIIAGITLAVLAVELLIAVILKLTVFKIKKDIKGKEL